MRTVRKGAITSHRSNDEAERTNTIPLTRWFASRFGIFCDGNLEEHSFDLLYPEIVLFCDQFYTEFSNKVSLVILEYEDKLYKAVVGQSTRRQRDPHADAIRGSGPQQRQGCDMSYRKGCFSLLPYMSQWRWSRADRSKIQPALVTIEFDTQASTEPRSSELFLQCFIFHSHSSQIQTNNNNHRIALFAGVAVYPIQSVSILHNLESKHIPRICEVSGRRRAESAEFLSFVGRHCDNCIVLHVARTTNANRVIAAHCSPTSHDVCLHLQFSAMKYNTLTRSFQIAVVCCCCLNNGRILAFRPSVHPDEKPVIASKKIILPEVLGRGGGAIHAKDVVSPSISSVTSVGRKKWGVDNDQPDEYWFDNRIHTLGNHGFWGAVHAAVAPLTTKIIDVAAYNGEDIRQMVRTKCNS